MPEPSGGEQGFFLPGGEQGILLVHGFLTSPGEMRGLGDHLAAAGMTVLGLRLRGHGTKPEDLAGVRWQDWVADVQQGLARLRQSCARIGLVGLSLGGALALYSAAHEPVERVAVCSTPDTTGVQSSILAGASLASRWIRFLPKIGSDVRDPAARRAHFTYRRIPLAAVAEIPPLLRAMQSALPRVRVPVLLVQARRDQVIPRRSAAGIAARLGGPSQIFYVPRGGHTVLVDYDREQVFRAIAQWLKCRSENSFLLRNSP
ncbi:MAG: alpha/beta fold hydrolase [Anaerolineae bacterium]|nr:alpha/beta fold hydrolase [Anaerolineae bacterium]